MALTVGCSATSWRVRIWVSGLVEDGYVMAMVVGGFGNNSVERSLLRDTMI